MSTALYSHNQRKHEHIPKKRMKKTDGLDSSIFPSKYFSFSTRYILSISGPAFHPFKKNKKQYKHYFCLLSPSFVF